MLIMCSKKDPGAYEFSKKLEKEFNVYLPKAKAKIARAPHIDRIINLMASNQIPLAILSYDLVNQLVQSTKEKSDFLKKETKMIFAFPDMVLIANQKFPEEKSVKIFNALLKATKESNDQSIKKIIKDDFIISYDKKIKLSFN